MVDYSVDTSFVIEEKWDYSFFSYEILLHFCARFLLGMIFVQDYLFIFVNNKNVFLKE